MIPKNAQKKKPKKKQKTPDTQKDVKLHLLRGSAGNPFPWKSVWVVKAPRKLYFFGWDAA